MDKSLDNLFRRTTHVEGTINVEFQLRSCIPKCGQSRYGDELARLIR